MSRPAANEHAPYWSRYIDLVPEDDVVGTLEQQAAETAKFLTSIPESRAGHRYGAGKWSIKELVNHVVDAERIFGYRAVSIARGDTQSLPGFDEQVFARHSDADRRKLADIAEELSAVRRSSVTLYRGLSDEAWERIGTANDSPIGVRTLAFVTVGHERHHLKILRERYL